MQRVPSKIKFYCERFVQLFSKLKREVLGDLCKRMNLFCCLYSAFSNLNVFIVAEVSANLEMTVGIIKESALKDNTSNQFESIVKFEIL